jgi:hypothetical protein
MAVTAAHACRCTNTVALGFLCSHRCSLTEAYLLFRHSGLDGPPHWLLLCHTSLITGCTALVCFLASVVSLPLQQNTSFSLSLSAERHCLLALTHWPQQWPLSLLSRLLLLQLPSWPASGAPALASITKRTKQASSTVQFLKNSKKFKNSNFKNSNFPPSSGCAAAPCVSASDSVWHFSHAADTSIHQLAALEFESSIFVNLKFPRNCD